MRDGAVAGVRTSRGDIATKRVLCAVAGSTPRMLKLIGLDSPLAIHPLQAMVSEPLKPWLDPIIVSSSLHAYVSQSARGELVMGASLDPYELHSTRSTLDFAEGLAANMLDLFPFLSEVKVNRQWAGMADMTPDFAPIMGTDALRGLFPRCGLGHLGIQGHADLGQDDGAHRRDRRSPSADHRFLARTLRAPRAHGRERRGLGGPLSEAVKIIRCPLNGPRPLLEFVCGGEVRDDARSADTAPTRNGRTTCSTAPACPA